MCWQAKVFHLFDVDITASDWSMPLSRTFNYYITISVHPSSPLLFEIEVLSGAEASFLQPPCLSLLTALMTNVPRVHFLRFILFYMCFAWMHVCGPHAYLLPTESIRRYYISCNWTFSLWVTMWLLETKHRSPARAKSALNLWVISSGPMPSYFILQILLAVVFTWINLYIFLKKIIDF